MNIKEQQVAACMTPSNRYWDSEMKLRQVATVQQAADQTLFCRGKRWVDSRILAKDESQKPDREVEFGSDEHFEIARRLASEDGGGRASLLSVQGEVYLLLDGQRVLIKAPGL